MTTHRARMMGRTVLWGVVVATLPGALVAAMTQSLAQAPAPVGALVVPTGSTGPSVVELLPSPSLPVLDLPDVQLPEAAAEKTSPDRCADQDYWNARQYGDPSDYVAACGEWPSWIPRDEDEPISDDGPGAAAYTGPTDGPWSPEYGYYEGRTDGPKNSNGDPCVQGRDNNDPNC